MEELLETLEMVPLYGRLAICLFVGILVPAYLSMDTIDGLSEQLSEAEANWSLWRQNIIEPKETKQICLN